MSVHGAPQSTTSSPPSPPSSSASRAVSPATEFLSTMEGELVGASAGREHMVPRQVAKPITPPTQRVRPQLMKDLHAVAFNAPPPTGPAAMRALARPTLPALEPKALLQPRQPSSDEDYGPLKPSEAGFRSINSSPATPSPQQSQRDAPMPAHAVQSSSADQPSHLATIPNGSQSVHDPAAHPILRPPGAMKLLGPADYPVFSFAGPRRSKGMSVVQSRENLTVDKEKKRPLLLPFHHHIKSEPHFHRILICYEPEQLSGMLIASAFNPTFLQQLNEAIEGEHPLFGPIIKRHLGARVFEQCVDYAAPELLESSSVVAPTVAQPSLYTKVRAVFQELVAGSAKEPLGAFEHALFVIDYLDYQSDRSKLPIQPIQDSLTVITDMLSKASVYDIVETRLAMDVLTAVSNAASLGPLERWNPVVIFDRTFKDWLELRARNKQSARPARWELQPSQTRPSEKEAREQLAIQARDEEEKQERALAKILGPILAFKHHASSESASVDNDAGSSCTSRVSKHRSELSLRQPNGAVCTACPSQLC
jgi:hypothetical protein